MTDETRDGSTRATAPDGSPAEASPVEASTPEASPKAPPKGAAEQRAARLKAALRDNLRRRKAQMRGRASGSGAPSETDPDA